LLPEADPHPSAIGANRDHLTDGDALLLRAQLAVSQVLLADHEELDVAADLKAVFRAERDDYGVVIGGRDGN
jgi:hypothetical protein